MCRYRWQRVPKTKAIRQENIAAGLAKLLLIEPIAIKRVAHDRLKCGDIYINRIYPASCHPPPALRDIILHPGVVFRIVLLCQHVPKSTFETEHIIRIPVKQLEVLRHRERNERVDSILDRPSPLGIQMGRADYTNSANLLLR